MRVHRRISCLKARMLGRTTTQWRYESQTREEAVLRNSMMISSHH